MNDKLILEDIENIKRKSLRLLTAQSKKLLIQATVILHFVINLDS